MTYIWGKEVAFIFVRKNQAQKRWRSRAWLIDPKKTLIRILYKA